MDIFKIMRITQFIVKLNAFLIGGILGMLIFLMVGCAAMKHKSVNYISDISGAEYSTGFTYDEPLPNFKVGWFRKVYLEALKNQNLYYSRTDYNFITGQMSSKTDLYIESKTDNKSDK